MHDTVYLYSEENTTEVGQTQIDGGLCGLRVGGV